jgi:hypothetical protein
MNCKEKYRTFVLIERGSLSPEVWVLGDLAFLTPDKEKNEVLRAICEPLGRRRGRAIRPPVGLP